ncbi:MAG TPA: 4-hydroxy-tetrahydrodipicolinate synthase [Acidimicrobiales bacterium]|nr:4-hydroxy-tetrahydrodipicolinate synthase [Acidimicrobiales bacterium]
MARFGSLITAMVTPFDRDGRVDLEGAAALAAWLVEQGNDGLVLTGSTGEGSVLSDDEQVEVWRAVRAAVDVPLVAATGTNDTAHAAELTGHASGAGMDGVLVVTPYYNRPPQAGLEAHFRTVAGATDLPVLLYDIPIRSSRKISHEVLLHLAHDVDNVVGLKDAAANPAETARVVAETPEGFEVWAGDDTMTLPMMVVGAVGVISVAAHWAAPEMSEMVGALQRGDVVKARELNALLIESYDFETSDLTPNPIPAKAMMRVLGQPAGQCRLPLGPAPEGVEARARAVHERLRTA